jgi:hypothetical protein
MTFVDDLKQVNVEEAIRELELVDHKGAVAAITVILCFCAGLIPHIGTPIIFVGAVYAALNSWMKYSKAKKPDGYQTGYFGFGDANDNYVVIGIAAITFVLSVWYDSTIANHIIIALAAGGISSLWLAVEEEFWHVRDKQRRGSRVGF